MRTIAGYYFRCKICKQIHFIKFKEPHDDIFLPCINSEYSWASYDMSDFTFYHGWDIGLSAISID